MSFRDELPSWRDVSKRLDELHAMGREEPFVRTCPVCDNANIRMETMETKNGDSAENSKIGFFTCISCHETWSSVIK